MGYLFCLISVVSVIVLCVNDILTCVVVIYCWLGVCLFVGCIICFVAVLVYCYLLCVSAFRGLVDFVWVLGCWFSGLLFSGLIVLFIWYMLRCCSFDCDSWLFLCSLITVGVFNSVAMLFYC